MCGVDDKYNELIKDFIRLSEMALTEDGVDRVERFIRTLAPKYNSSELNKLVSDLDLSKTFMIDDTPPQSYIIENIAGGG